MESPSYQFPHCNGRYYFSWAEYILCDSLLDVQPELPESLRILLQRFYSHQASSIQILPVQQQKGGLSFVSCLLVG